MKLFPSCFVLLCTLTNLRYGNTSPIWLRSDINKE